MPFRLGAMVAYFPTETKGGNTLLLQLIHFTHQHINWDLKHGRKQEHQASLQAEPLQVAPKLIWIVGHYAYY